MTISYSSESGYPREAIERMLLGLSPNPDEQGDQGALTNASIGAGFNLLEREIARELPLFDTVEIDHELPSVDSLVQRFREAGFTDVRITSAPDGGEFDVEANRLAVTGRA